MKLIIFLLLPLSLFCQASPYSFKVKRVIDGDTFVIEEGYKIRLINIDAPETTFGKSECGGQEARRVLDSLIVGRQVVIIIGEVEKDRYGRLLGYVYEGDIFVNSYLVSHGLARAVDYRQGNKRVFTREQAFAKAMGYGIWNCK